jgi:hypothetical protein
MPDCCDSLKSYPTLQDICLFGTGSGAFTCGELDAEYRYIDYTSDPPLARTAGKDDSISAFELLASAVKAARSSYYKTVFSEADEFTGRLRSAGLVPPWFIYDKDVVKDVYEMKSRAKTGDELADMLAGYLRKRVLPKEHNEPTARPDKLFRRGYGNCVETANAFYGLCVLANIECGFAIRYSKERENFHILNFAGRGKKYYDLAGAGGRPAIDITPVEAMLYFETEARLTCTSCEEEKVVKELAQYSDWLPHDFHIPYSLAMYLENINNKDAAIWLKKTAELNPFFAPATGSGLTN